MRRLPLIAMAGTVLLFSCSPKMAATSTVSANPQVVVYKTKADYHDYVPVTLSADKSKIISYPAPSDVQLNGIYTFPSKLKNGFLLDNRGVNTNTAFLDISYVEYAKLSSVDVNMLFMHIKDNAPFTALYMCGDRYAFKDIITELNKKIKDDKLSDCKCLIK
jgi:hypothetical protein